MTGQKWPNPSEPGVPAIALLDGFHWLAWPKTGVPTLGQWSPDLWRWVVTFWGEMVTPENMAHLDYLGIANPPSTQYGSAHKTTSPLCPDDLPKKACSYMTTDKPVTLAASPLAVFNMLDHTESVERLNQRIEQFCQLIADRDAAALWRRDLLFLLDQWQRKQHGPNA